MITYSVATKKDVQKGVDLFLHAAHPSATIPPSDESVRAGIYEKMIYSGIDLSQQIVAKTEGHIIGTCIFFANSPDLALATVPIVRSGFDTKTISTGLLAYLITHLEKAKFAMVQALLDEPQWQACGYFTEAGFDFLAEFLCMERKIQHNDAAGINTKLHWNRYSFFHHKEFARVIKGTYEGSMDCVRLPPETDINKVIEDHKKAGIFDRSLWLLGKDACKEPFGVILTSWVPHKKTFEIMYMGILPRFRGKGLGRQLLLKAFSEVAKHGGEVVSVVVDADNKPACRLYASLRFTIQNRKKGFFRRLT